MSETTFGLHINLLMDATVRHELATMVRIHVNALQTFDQNALYKTYSENGDQFNRN